MAGKTGKLRHAFAANRKALIWLLATYIPVAFGAGSLGFWLFHNWDLGFIVAALYVAGLLLIWGRMLVAIRSSD